MPSPNVYSFGIDPISCHSFNKDRTQVALSPNNNEVHVYSLSGGTWTRTATLDSHMSRVTSLDWAPESNRIATCGADRNAYVWRHKDGQWEPTLVILRINRAATCVKWSPQENKFAVGSGARSISICYFEKENDWWVSKHIKKPIRSTITSLDWHPNNVLLAAGASDYKARVFSAYVKEVDEKPVSTAWGKKMTFAHLMAEFTNPRGGGWVHSVSFSASGDKLAWVASDSSVSVVTSSADLQHTSICHQYLPFVSCVWVGEATLVAAGHDCCPMLFRHDDKGQITFITNVDQQKTETAAKVSAFNLFKNLDKLGADSMGEGTTKLTTKHQNTISQVSIYKGDRARTEVISTCGIDGQIILWNFKDLESSVAGLKIC